MWLQFAHLNGAGFVPSCSSLYLHSNDVNSLEKEVTCTYSRDAYRKCGLRGKIEIFLKFRGHLTYLY